MSFSHFPFCLSIAFPRGVLPRPCLRVADQLDRAAFLAAYPNSPGARNSDMEDSGPFEARYLAFLETITNLRPALHRYCSRMIGSVLDGEDVVQNALFQAFRKLDTYKDFLP